MSLWIVIKNCNEKLKSVGNSDR